MPTTSRGIEYPASTDAPRIWEDMQALASTADDAIGAIGVTRYVKKAATEQRTSTTTLADDADLVVIIPANKVCRVSLHAIVTGAAAADVKLAWRTSGGVAALTNRHVTGPAVGTTNATDGQVRTSGAHGLTTAIVYGTDGTNGSRVVEDFLVETTSAGASGLLAVQWAQNVSSATASSLNGSSFLIVTEMVPA